MKYAEILDSLLKERGIKPAEFARMLGTNRSTIATILKGENEPRLRTAKKIADALDVDINYFIDRMDF